MSHFHAIEDARPAWARDAEELCANRADAASYLRRLYLPLCRDGETLVVALADASTENRCWIEARYGVVRFIAVSGATLLTEISRRFETDLTDAAVFSLAREQPELSAQRVVSQSQGAGLVVLAVLSAFAFVMKPLVAFAVFVAVMTLIFIGGTFFRVLLSWLGRLGRESTGVARRDDETLPVYSILVPLYREAKIVPDLLQALSLLEYPQNRLDIKIVVEADDHDTIRACEEFQALHPFEVVRVPPSLPRTKPNSCVAFLSAFAAVPLFLGFPG